MDEYEEKKICVDGTRNRDRISSLPDCLLHHVLSFLDVKSSVQTSLLSRRWKHVWASTRYLKFHFKFEDYADAVEVSDEYEWRIIDKKKAAVGKLISLLIDNVMRGRDGHQIEKFVLWCDVWLGTWFMKKLLCYVIRHKVREIEIYSEGAIAENDQFPKCFYANESLEKFTLVGVAKSSFFCWSKTTGFQTLKELRLQDIEFTSFGINHKIFPKCPALESLILINCFYTYSSDKLEVSAPRLKKLEIVYPPDGGSSCKLFSEVVVSAPKLLYFKFQGPKPVKCSFDADTNSVEDVDIDVYGSLADLDVDRRKYRVSDVVGLLKGIGKAESIILSGKTFQILAEMLHSEVPSETSPCKWRNIKVKWSGLEPVWNFLKQGSPQDLNLHFEDPIHTPKQSC